MSDLPALSERDFQAQVVSLATMLGFRVYHTHDSRRSAPGFPDLTLVRGSRLLFVELKAEKGKVTPAQNEWLDALRATSAEVYVWRPSDLDAITVALAPVR